MEFFSKLDSKRVLISLLRSILIVEFMLMDLFQVMLKLRLI